ncbi:MAG: hypothetical protein FH753_13055 [Firmicutes bacterium]|nr:hypothetical protein [Bacillota bacterium]
MITLWHSLTIEQKLDLLKQIVPTVSIVIGAMVSLFVFSKTKEKEIEFKVHAQRKEKYEKYLAFYQKTLANVDKIKQGELPISREEWIDIQLGLIVYGSEEVIHKTVELNKIGRSKEYSNNQMILVKMGELMHIMREEVGLSNKNLSIRDSLSLLITDIFDSKYDDLFSKKKS